MFTKKMSLVLILAFLIAFQPSLALAAETSFLQNNKNLSTWLWDTQDIKTNPDKVIKFLVGNKVNTVYLQIDYDLDLNIYRSFIKKASANKISVQALEGSTLWIGINRVAIQTKFFNWLSAYQKTSKSNEVFKGVHLDIEPYLASEFNTNKNKTIEIYQDVMTNLINNSKKLNLLLSIDIPFWFNEITYSSKYGSGNLAEWIFKNIKNVVIMAYRDKALGSGGIVNIAKNEMNLGKKYGAKVTIAVETSKSAEGNNISFYEEGKRYMANQLKIVNTSYSTNTAFDGFAIEYLNSWMTLKN